MGYVMTHQITPANIQLCTPLPWQFPQLRQLWKDTFGDSDAFLDLFQKTAFSKNRCHCAVMEGTIIAALYWFDCEYLGQPLAYIYAVATAKDYRKKGICHMLMADIHRLLKERGYIGTVLSPANKNLFGFYETMGYCTCLYHKKLSFPEDTLYAFGHIPLSIRSVKKEEFALLRRKFVPNGAVLQEKENLDFLEQQAIFYTGKSVSPISQKNETPKDFLLAATMEDRHLEGLEFLGDESLIPSILSTLGCTGGTISMPGMEEPSAMYHPFTESSEYPKYLGFSFA